MKGCRHKCTAWQLVWQEYKPPKFYAMAVKWRKGYKARGYLNAVVFHGTDLKQLQAASYHNIKDSDTMKKKFFRFALQQFPLVRYVNFYNSITKKYSFRVYRQNFNL